MVNIKLSNTPNDVVVEDNLIIETHQVEPFGDRIPANWSITPAGDCISAINTNSGESFYGTTKEFSAKLRG